MTTLQRDAAWQLPGMRRITPVVGRWPVRITVVQSPALHLPATVPRGVEPVVYDSALAALLSLGEDRPALLLVPADVRLVPAVEIVAAVSASTAIPVAVACPEDEQLLDVATQALTAGASTFIPLPLAEQQLLDLATRFGGARDFGDAETVQVGGLRVDGQAFRVYLDGEALSVPPREFAVLHFLAEQHPRVVSVEELADRWTDGNLESIRVLINRLRKRLGSIRPAPHRSVIETVRGRGYRLDASV